MNAVEVTTTMTNNMDVSVLVEVILWAFHYPYRIRKALMGAVSAKTKILAPQNLDGFTLLQK
jgi:hypothetical protein